MENKTCSIFIAWVFDNKWFDFKYYCRIPLNWINLAFLDKLFEEVDDLIFTLSCKRCFWTAFFIFLTLKYNFTGENLNLKLFLKQIIFETKIDFLYTKILLIKFLWMAWNHLMLLHTSRLNNCVSRFERTLLQIVARSRSEICQNM